jgi:demethylmenaquinone methyltransferase/2-methoxy-6-polyprenyl-1,4-benzoquinol methylase
MSSSYERVNYITSFGFSIRWRTQFLNNFQKKNTEVEIIDLLTGMGETWKATKKKFPDSQLTVLDFSEGMLQYAEKKNKEMFNEQIIILHQDVLQNQLPANRYDFITCAFGLKTFNDEQIKKLAKETKRILKEGGQFSFIEVSVPENRLLRMLYCFYIGSVIPVLGKLLLGNSEAYKMLGRYTSRFENAKNATALFKKEGLDVQYQSYFYGCATGFTGTKITR